MSEKANSSVFHPCLPGGLEMVMQSGRELCGSPERILRSRESQTILDLVPWGSWKMKELFFPDSDRTSFVGHTT